jgi:hypothetical protein
MLFKINLNATYKAYMILRPIITLLMFCCLTAHAANNNIELQNNHPDRYVVVKGDTLWGISAKFLKDPWQWPHIWKMNKAEISNPHLIYPGDVIVLTMVNGKPQLTLLKETITLSPDVRIEPLDKEAIPSISPQTIGPFLNRPLVIEKNDLNNAPVIIAGSDNRVVLSHGNKIYIDQVNQDANLHWHIYRPGNPIIDPDSKVTLGTEANYLGDAKVLKLGAPATAEITRAKEEIFVGDRLVLAKDDIQTNLSPHGPDSKITGKIISIYGGIAETGSNSVVVINLGKKEGIEEGHVLSINHVGRYVSRNPKDKSSDEKVKQREMSSTDNKVATLKSDNKNNPANDPKLIKLPNERVGLLMVFRVFERVSYALIMQASESITNADLVQTPE